MRIRIDQLTQEQQTVLRNLQLQAEWFGRFFMRQADRILTCNEPRNDQ